MIGICKECGSRYFTIDMDEDGDWRMNCSYCNNPIYDSHNQPYPDVKDDPYDDE